MKIRFLMVAMMAVLALVALMGGYIDTDTALGGALMANVAAADVKALEAAMKKAFDVLGGRVKATAEEQAELRLMVIDLAQKGGRVPQSSDAGASGELIDAITKSGGFQAFQKGETPTFSLKIPSRLLFRNSIVNAPGQNQPLVPSDRGQGIVFAPQQRLTIRSLFRQLPTSSNLIERASESSFTNNARPQGDASPGGVEGELKAESAMAFTLTSVAIVTLAHYIIASRQVLSDAPLLQGHIESRLLYGLNLEEEQEFLTGDGTAGTVNGINNQASAFSGGVTNATRLDTLARAAVQLANSNYEASAYILSPSDWLAVVLEKDDQGRYLLGDPGAQRAPMLWGLPVVVTPSQTAGQFTCLDAARFGYVADREDAVVRISENVSDQFVRNLITVLCEKRTTLVTELAGAAVYGALTYAG